MVGQSATRAGSAVWESCYFTASDGLDLHFRDCTGRGDAPSILCLHGLTRNSRDFEYVAARYSDRFRVIALDFRGRGLSAHDSDPSRYTAATYVADVIALLDHLGVEKMIAIGTSLGGLVTMLLAGIQPGRITAAVLNDVGPDLAPAGLERIRGYVGKSMHFANWDAAAEKIALSHRNLPASYGHDDWLRVARRLCREGEGGVSFDYDPAIAKMFDQAPTGQSVDLWPFYRSLASVPLLIIRGSESDLVTDAAARQLVEAAANARLATVSRVGHAPFLDEPESIAALDSFLADRLNS